MSEEKYRWIARLRKDGCDVTYYAETHIDATPDNETWLAASSYYGFGAHGFAAFNAVRHIGETPDLDTRPFSRGHIKIWRVLSPGEKQEH